MVQALSSALAASPAHLTVILNSIDAVPLRRPATQQLLAQLAAHPRIRLVATADTPSFPLLWDAAQRTSFNFLFHDCTTLQPLDVELDAVDEVHELLGRKARRVNGKDGVVFVLRSLPENAKKLFELLVIEVLSVMDDGEQQQFGAENPGVEYRMVYNKAVEDFICSSEMAFRTLLKEFHDHQIITSRKDTLGTELLSIPFGREELEAILEDLMS
ncbi:Origin recognition complex subunit 2 [Colletotrichum tanaceti]|nr:Origin recognition complex subunit 2 [Colletotrichum tanaceti]